MKWKFLDFSFIYLSRLPVMERINVKFSGFHIWNKINSFRTFQIEEKKLWILLTFLRYPVVIMPCRDITSIERSANSSQIKNFPPWISRFTLDIEIHLRYRDPPRISRLRSTIHHIRALTSYQKHEFNFLIIPYNK